ncbi:MAG: sulfurtransferase-like selenium metabolism protein YedF [Desulfomonile sp.]|nr:sulfurtransferase-like selenium metabolism protein YedF [Desulfomonile sp.]
MSQVLTVDARGLACPQPVLETKKLLDQSLDKPFAVLVDNVNSRENVARFAGSQGCRVEVHDREGYFEILVEPSAQAAKAEIPPELLVCDTAAAPADARIVVYVGNDCMGRGDDVLGTMLMRGFLRTWIDVKPQPWRMIFINSGVRLTTMDDEAVDALSLLAERGVEILSCGTCLKHFNLEDKLKVGKVTNMFEVIETLTQAGKVVSPD